MTLQLTKFADQVIPKDFLAKGVKSFPEGTPVFCTFAIADKDKDGKEQLTIMRSQPFVIDEFMEMQTAYKSPEMVVQLYQPRSGELEEDQQPFALLTDREDKLVVIGFVAGEYPTFTKKESTHSPEFFAAIEGIRPSLLEIYDACSGDLEDFSEELKGKVLERKFQNLGTTVSVVVMVANGRIQGFIKNGGVAKEFPWGFASNGFEEAKPTAVENKGSMLDRLKGAAGGVVAKVTGTEQKPPADKPVEEAPVTTPKPDKIGTGDEFDMVSPPSHIDSNKGLKNWYKRNVGYVPDDHKQRPAVPIKKSIKDLKHIPSREAIEAKRADKDTATHHISKVEEPPKRATPDTPVETAPKPDNKTGDGLWRIPEDEVKRLQTSFMKMPSVVATLDAADEDVMPPEIVADADAAVKSFNEQLGIDGGLERTKNWRRTLLMTLCMQSRAAAVRLLEEWRFKAMILQAENAGLLAELGRTRTPASPTKPAAVASPTNTQPATPPASTKTPVSSALGVELPTRVPRKRAAA